MTLDKKVPERQNAALAISPPDIPARDWWNDDDPPSRSL
jgi:hypothetical protein